MVEPQAPSRRPYDATARRARAAESRRRVVAEAHDLFVERGFAATTVADVARAAGVSVPTVFGALGSKAGLLKACVDVALAGDDEPVPVARRPLAQWVYDTADAVELLGRYAVMMGELAARAAPIYDVMVRAADAEPDLAALQATFEAQRLRASDMVVEGVVRCRGLPAGRTPEEARDVVWVLNAPELYVSLTRRRGWTTDRYVRWARDTLVALVLGAPAPGEPPAAPTFREPG